MAFSAGGIFNRRGDAVHDLAMAGIAGMLAITVFYVDTFTDIESAIATLYVIVLLLASEVLTRRGLMLTALGCSGLAIISYLYAHGVSPDLQTLLRLVVSIAALMITMLLLLRTEKFRYEILAKNAALRESEKRYRSIFDQTRVALWERDYSRLRVYLMSLKSEGVANFQEYARKHPDVVDHCMALVSTVAANDAARELVGEAAARAGAGLMRQMIIPQDQTFIELTEAIFEGRDHFEGKGTVITDSGEKKLVLLTVSFPDDATAFDRVVVGMLDITQREMTQKALQDAQDELARASRAATVGAMSASLAHELNQPLGAIVMNSQTLMRWLDRDPPDFAAVRRSAERMIRDAKRASDIIQNTRNLLSQTDSNPEWIDLESLVSETRSLIDHDLERYAVAVNLQIEANLPMVGGVRIELQQVLINLMTNAIQAMAANVGPKVLTIKIGRHQDNEVAVSVRDSGPGISEEALTKIFTPFYTTKSSGMGMGLSICRGTLEARGGRLEGNNHPAGGAIFEMILPMGDNHD